jgi:hypothetical protein
MNTVLSPPKTTCILLALAGFALGAQAIPTPIAGVISFSGTSTIDGTSFVTATKFVSFQDIVVGAESALSGDYVGTSGAAVTMTPFTWSPSTASTPINPLWSFVSGGTTFSFDLSVLHQDYASATGLLLSGFGTAHITGAGIDKLDTDGHWNLSAQTLDVATFTFSSTTTVPPPSVPPRSVPDGGTTVLMLGGSLLGLAFINRKRTPLKLC